MFVPVLQLLFAVKWCPFRISLYIHRWCNVVVYFAELFIRLPSNKQCV